MSSSRDSQHNGLQSLPVTISRRTSDMGANFTGEPNSFDDIRYNMDKAMAMASPTPTPVHILDELQQHYNHEADPGFRFRSQSIGAPLSVEKTFRHRLQDNRGSMIEDAIKLMSQWGPVTTDLPERSRASSCSVVESHRISDSSDVRFTTPVSASQARGDLLLNKLTGSPRLSERSGSVSRSRAGSLVKDHRELEDMDETMEYLAIRTLEPSNGRAQNGHSERSPSPVRKMSINNGLQHEEEKRGFDLTTWTTPRPSPGMTLLPRPSHTGLLLSGISSPIAQTPGLEMLTSFLPPLNVLSDRRWQDPIPVSQVQITDPIEMQAKAHRASAAQSEPRCTWSGQLPVRAHKNPVYSPKVFLGGVPFDISDAQLVEAFSPYGTVKVQWPPNRPHVQQENRQQKCGYLYVIFEHDKNVKALLQACTHDYTRSVLRYFFTLSSRRSKFKEVQVIPWNTQDSNYVKSPAQRLDTQKTVFVGALHGMLTAEGLATVMNDLFGGVAYVGIDTDKYRYPIGSCRLTFNNQRSYMKAVQAEFVDIKAHFNKKIQVDPYIGTALCSTCNLQQGPIFCRDPHCFRYFCRSCWQWVHSAPELDKHKPLMRYRRE